VGEIAKTANVTTGAIYRHFKNKEELFFTLIEDVYEYTLDIVTDVEIRSTDKASMPLSEETDNVVIEALFSETMRFVDYMYEHFDEFKLLLACSKGSRVENFAEEIADRYTHKNMKLIQAAAGKKSSATKIKELEVHIITKGYITSLCECIIHAIPYDDVSRYIKSIVTFQYYGWGGLLNELRIYHE
jgi:transcriptional regulator, tetR family